ncbi:hypothetical protein BDF22DRAFT_741082 [Syncephalis plumigaleata]|nr:hypothetical protein BDF22DRAFT_741082 [Syncephalis plumigaleata]
MSRYSCYAIPFILAIPLASTLIEASPQSFTPSGSSSNGIPRQGFSSSTATIGTSISSSIISSASSSSPTHLISTLSSDEIPNGYRPFTHVPPKTKNAYGQPGLYVRDWEQKGSISIAQVIHGLSRGILKCFYDRNMYNHEYDVYTALNRARKDKQIVGHPIVDLWRNDYTISIMGTTVACLNWSNIMINENYLVDPFITIVNFSLASRFKSKETDPVQLSRIPKRTVAFSPPEAYVDIDYDLQKSDTWSLMMVALAFYEGNVNGVGQILYGKFQAYTQPEYEQRMVELYHEYWGTEDKYVLHSSTYRMFDYISKAASTLFIVDVNARLTPTGYIDRYQVSHPKLY